MISKRVGCDNNGIETGDASGLPGSTFITAVADVRLLGMAILADNAPPLQRGRRWTNRRTMHYYRLCGSVRQGGLQWLMSQQKNWFLPFQYFFSVIHHFEVFLGGLLVHFSTFRFNRLLLQALSNIHAITQEIQIWIHQCYTVSRATCIHYTLLHSWFFVWLEQFAMSRLQTTLKRHQNRGGYLGFSQRRGFGGSLGPLPAIFQNWTCQNQLLEPLKGGGWSCS